jgi:hypothetical protein
MTETNSMLLPGSGDPLQKGIFASGYALYGTISIKICYSPMSGLSPRIGSSAIAVSWSSTCITGALNGDHGVGVFGQVHVGVSNGGASCKENQKSNRESSFESFHSTVVGLGD